LPDWVEAGKEPDPSLREVDASRSEWDDKRVMPAGEMLDSAVKSGKSVMGQGAPKRTNGMSGEINKEKTLDDWLEESEVEEQSEEEDDEEDDDEEGEESEEEESGEEISEEEDESDVDDKEHDRLVK
jgi:hypothetical protein